MPDLTHRVLINTPRAIQSEQQKRLHEETKAGSDMFSEDFSPGLTNLKARGIRDTVQNPNLQVNFQFQVHSLQNFFFCSD